MKDLLIKRCYHIALLLWLLLIIVILSKNVNKIYGWLSFKNFEVFTSDVVEIFILLFHLNVFNVVYFLHFLQVFWQFFWVFLLFLQFFFCFLHFLVPILSLHLGLFPPLPPDPPDPPDLHFLQVTGHSFATFFDLHFFCCFLHEEHFLVFFLHVSLHFGAKIQQIN